MGVEWAWHGGLTTSTARVKARISDGTSARLAYTTDPFLQPANCAYAATPPVDGMATFELAGLSANTTYHYAVEVDGAVALDKRGKFKTFPSGAASFSFTFGGCQGAVNGVDQTTGPFAHSNPHTADARRSVSPLFDLHLGDLHYEDSPSGEHQEWRDIYDRVMANHRTAQLYRDVPLVYVYDNHDFVFSDPRGSSAGALRRACREVYRERVPSYLPVESGDAAIYYSFLAARTRTIMLDTISERSSPSVVDDASKSMLGATQKEWLKDTLSDATEEVIFLGMPAAPWIGGADDVGFQDRWSVFNTERNELAAFFVASGKASRIVLLSSDAHMLAWDDGTNAPGGIKVLQAGPLDRGGIVLGGPYSGGTSALRGQFGIVDVIDSGGTSIDVVFNPCRLRGQDGTALYEPLPGTTFNIAA